MHFRTASTRTGSARARKTSAHKTLAFIISSFLFLTLFLSSRAIASDKGNPPVLSCGFSDAAFDTSTDIRAVQRYQDAIAQLLKQEKFSELDCIAEQARAAKARFSGGMWKLHAFLLWAQ